MEVMVWLGMLVGDRKLSTENHVYRLTHKMKQMLVTLFSWSANSLVGVDLE